MKNTSINEFPGEFRTEQSNSPGTLKDYIFNFYGLSVNRLEFSKT